MLVYLSKFSVNSKILKKWNSIDEGHAVVL